MDGVLRSCSASSFMNFLVHVLLSLPAHSGRICAQIFFVLEISGGGGGGGGGQGCLVLKGWFI